MADYYFDPEGGNNANTGLSFAQRKKSWDGFSPAANDNIRIMAARDPYTLGNADWTNGSSDVVLAAAKNATIDNCDTAWTAGSANVTSSQQTTATFGRLWKQGTGYSRFVVATAFTTGIVAYRALPSTLNLSAYTAISFKFGSSVAVAANQYRLDLCSDAVGAVPVASFVIPASPLVSPAVGYNVFLENGGALPSNVNSIALYAITDPGTGPLNVGIDNIIACQSRGHADHLNHDSIIGKNVSGKEEFYPIRCIDGTTITLGSPLSTPASPGRTYGGVTETITTYAIQPQMLDASGQFSGSTTPVTVSGGWDRTAMSSQTGETVLGGKCAWVGYAFRRSSMSMDFTKCSFTGFQVGANYLTLTGASTLQGKYATGNLQVIGEASGFTSVNIDYMTMNDAFGTAGALGPSSIRCAVVSKLWDGCSQTNYGFWMVDYAASGNPPNAFTVQIDLIRNNTVGYGGATLKGSEASLKNAVFSGNAVDLPGAAAMNQMNLEGCTFARTIQIGQMSSGGKLIYTKRNGDPLLNGYCTHQATLESQTTSVPPSGDTHAWQHISGDPAIKMVLARMAVTAGKTYGIAFDGMRSSNTSGFIGRIEVIDTNGTAYSDDIDGTATVWTAGGFSFVAAADGYVDITIGNPVAATSARSSYVANIVTTET